MSRIIKLSTITLLLIFLTMSGSAQVRRLGFFVNAAGYFPSEDNIKSGYGSGIGVTLFAVPNVSVSFEWKYGRSNVDKKEGEFLAGTLYMTPVVASIQYNIKTGTSFSPYIFGGGGLFFSSIKLEKDQTPEEQNVREQEIKNGLGLYGGVGGAFKINERLSLFLEGLYMRRTANVETFYRDNSPVDTFKANLSAFSVLIGLDYFY